MSKNLALALGLAFTVIAIPANAETMRVQTGDLDLSTEAGRKTLDQRILSAARKICSTAEPTTGSRVASTARADCAKQTAADTKEKIAVAKARTNG